MKIKILTLFPEMIRPVLESSILGRAIKNGYISVELIDVRDYAENKHKNADDYPFGGGAGMVMLPQPIVDAIEQNAEPGMRRVYMSPRGRTLTQKVVEEYRSSIRCCCSAATMKAWISARWTCASMKNCPWGTMF